VTTRDAIEAHLRTLGHSVGDDGTGLAVTGLVLVVIACMAFLVVLARNPSGPPRRPFHRSLIVLTTVMIVCMLSGFVLIGVAGAVASSHWIPGASEQVRNRAATRMAESARHDLVSRYAITRVSDTEVISVIDHTGGSGGCTHLEGDLFSTCDLAPWGTYTDRLDGLADPGRGYPGPVSAAVTTEDGHTLLYRIGLNAKGRLVLTEALDGAPGPNHLLRH
jgi:hypothetical protein